MKGLVRLLSFVQVKVRIFIRKEMVRYCSLPCRHEDASTHREQFWEAGRSFQKRRLEMSNKEHQL